MKKFSDHIEGLRGKATLLSGRFVRGVVAFTVGLSIASSSLAMEYNYVTVTCGGGRALVRFTSASDDDPPNFSQLGFAGLPSPIDLDLAKSQKVSHSCHLLDHRTVRVKQKTLSDSTDAMGGGDPSSIFTLSVGGRKLYSGAYNYRVEGGSEIDAIGVHGRIILECRARVPSVDDTVPPKMSACKDASWRFRYQRSK